MSAAVSALFAVVLVAVAPGLAVDRLHCERTQHAASTVNADLDRDAGPHSRAFVASGQVPTPRPTCDSDRLPGTPGVVSTRLVRLIDHDDGEPQRTGAPSFNGVRAAGATQPECHDASLLISRAQGTLGTVRSVVLRL
jgi:hypothetical protein